MKKYYVKETITALFTNKYYAKGDTQEQAIIKGGYVRKPDEVTSYTDLWTRRFFAEQYIKNEEEYNKKDKDWGHHYEVVEIEF